MPSLFYESLWFLNARPAHINSTVLRLASKVISQVLFALCVLSSDYLAG